MASVVISGDTSGAVTITAPAVAGTPTLTLPTATDTLIGRATTDTLTNKSIVASQLTGTIAGARMPAGSVLQVVNATYSTESDFNSTSFADTNLTATITPTSATSKILILVTQADCAKFDSNNFVKLKLVRNSTDILTFGATGAATNSTALNAIGSISASYLDSPATTSATTYKTQVASQSASVGIRLQYNNSSSTITLMEIAA
jgi:hypothetical protein